MLVLITSSAAAQILGVSVRTVHNYAQDGTLGVERLTAGRHRRFDRAVVETLRDRMRAAGGGGCESPPPGD